MRGEIYIWLSILICYNKVVWSCEVNKNGLASCDRVRLSDNRLVRVVIVVNVCHHPRDVLFSLQSGSWRWKHTFINSDESHPVVGLSDLNNAYALLHVKIDRPDNTTLHVWANFVIDGLAQQVFFNHSFTIDVTEKECITETKRNQWKDFTILVIFVVLCLLVILGATLVFAALRRHRRIRKRESSPTHSASTEGGDRFSQSKCFLYCRKYCGCLCCCRCCYNCFLPSPQRSARSRSGNGGVFETGSSLGHRKLLSDRPLSSTSLHSAGSHGSALAGVGDSYQGVDPPDVDSAEFFAAESSRLRQSRPVNRASRPFKSRSFLVTIRNSMYNENVPLEELHLPVISESSGQSRIYTGAGMQFGSLGRNFGRIKKTSTMNGSATPTWICAQPDEEYLSDLSLNSVHQAIPAQDILNLESGSSQPHYSATKFHSFRAKKQPGNPSRKRVRQTRAVDPPPLSSQTPLLVTNTSTKMCDNRGINVHAYGHDALPDICGNGQDMETVFNNGGSLRKGLLLKTTSFDISGKEFSQLNEDEKVLSSQHLLANDVR